MAFNDITGVSYNALIQHTKKVKPYKGTNGAYNLGYRKYSDRHFRVRDNGVIEVFFSHMPYVKNKIEKGENLYGLGSRHLANIHPDNSIEIIRQQGQGDVQFLSAMIPYVTHSKAHHGLLIRSRNTSHVIFRGGRYSLDSHEAVTPYILQPRAVNRKMRKEVIARFDTFKKVAYTMFEPMSSQGIFDIYKELWNEYGESALHDVNPDLIVKLVHENKYLDALMLTQFSKHDFGWWTMWKVKQAMDEEARPSSGRFNDARLNNFFGEDFKRSMRDVFVGSPEGKEGVERLNDLLIKGSPDAFHYKDPIPNGQAIPSSKWGYKLTDMAGNNLFRIE